MKKTVKGLIIAASVAAVVGVGAVSFAKWEQGTTTDVDVTGNVGSIVTLGAITANTDLGTKVLVPYDQVDQYDANTMAKDMTITLQYDGAAGATLKMVASGTLAAKLEYQKEDSSWATFDTEVVVNAATVKDTDTTVKVRLNSNATGDMTKDYTITFSAEAPTVEESGS